MVCTYLNGPAYAGIAGFGVGVGAVTLFLMGSTFKTVGPSLSIFPIGGLLFATAAVVGRIADDALKHLGWNQYANTRLVVAHALTAVLITAAASVFIGEEFAFSLAMGILLAGQSLFVNLIVRDILA